MLPVGLEDVKFTDDTPAQKVVAPFAVIIGVGGNGLTVTAVGIDVALHPPLVTVTE